jgi:hypothetical protein
MALDVRALGVDEAIPHTPAGPSASGARPRRSRALFWSVIGVVVVESLYALWTASRAYFFQDDFVDFQLLRPLGFDGRMLEQPIFGHFIPGFTLVDYLLSLIVPYQWWVIEIIEVTLFAMSLLLLYRLLNSLFGSTWVTVPLVALAGVSFSLVPSLTWWTTGLEYLVAIPATLLAITSHLTYLRSGRLRHAILGALSLAVGLAFYDGLFVSFLFVVLMTALFWPVGPGLRGSIRALAARWRAWLCYGLPVVAELGWRFTHETLYSTGPLATIGQTLEFIELSWTQTLIPLTFGVDAWLLPTHLERVSAGILGQVAFALFVAWTIHRWTSAWRAWVLLGVSFCASAALVGFTRVSYLGPGDASDVKYVGLDAFFLVIAVGLSLMPIVSPAFGRPAALDGIEPIDTRRSNSAAQLAKRLMRPVHLQAVATFAILASIVVYGSALILDQNREWESAGSHSSRQFFSDVSQSMATLGPTDRIFLWDTEVNPIVVSHKFYSDDLASVTVGRLYPEIHFDEWGRKGYLIRSDGSIVSAKVVTEATGIIPGPRGACVESSSQSQVISLTLNHGLKSAERWFGLISYESSTDTIALESTGASVVFRKGAGTLITGLPPAAVSSVSWNVPPRSSLCVTGFRVVLPEPAATNIPAPRSLDVPQLPVSR